MQENSTIENRCKGKAMTTGPSARRKCTPIPACGGTSPKGKHVTGFSVVYDSLRIQFLCHPGGGKSSLRSAFALISISKHSAAKICPSGEDAAEGGRRGAFLSPAGRFACFLPPARAVVWFYHADAFYKLKAPTKTLTAEGCVKLKNPLPPLNPHAHRACP